MDPFGTLPTIALLIAFSPSLQAQDIEIHQLDVGQGDAALVIVRRPSSPILSFSQSPSPNTPCPMRYALLIDSGPKAKGRTVIIPYLRKLHIDTLNAIVSTHYHADHIGGVNEILNSEVVLKCYDHGGSYDSKTFDTYVSLSGSKRATLSAGDTLLAVSFPNSSIRCSIICVASGGNIRSEGVQLPTYTGTSPVPLAPSGISSYSGDENTRSIAILLTYIANTDTFKFLTAGDLTASQESSLAIHNPSTHNVTIMKVSHHGSQTSTSPDALQFFAPNAVFISCGDNNQYGHPHAETIKTLDDQNSIEHIYQTERGNNVCEKSVVAGNIVVKVFRDGYYTIKTEQSTDTLYFDARRIRHTRLPISSPNLCLSRKVLIREEDKACTERSRSGEGPSFRLTYHDSAINLSIRPPVYVQTISVLNILGTTLRRFNPMDYVGSIIISDRFNSGVYFLMVKTDSRITTRKVIVDQ